MGTNLKIAIIILIIFLFSPTLLQAGDGYLTVKNGYLYENSRRVRLWGVHLSPGLSVLSYEMADMLVPRLKAMGFNAICIWGLNEMLSAHGYELPKSKKGDNSPFDRMDYLIYRCHREGIYVWFGMMTRLPSIKPADADVLPGISEQDAADWQEAIAWTLSDYQRRKWLTRAFYADDRLQKLRILYLRNLLNRMNPYTGHRYAEDPAISLYYLHDEVNFVLNAFWNVPSRYWHPYFQREFQRKWNEWLKVKYGSDDKLTDAWGTLGKDESIEDDSIACVTGKQPPMRARDFAAFCLHLVDVYHNRLIREIRQMAPEGIGSNVVPIASDTCGYARLWAIYSALQGDIAAVSGCFRWGMDSALNAPPSFQNPKHGESMEFRIKGKPWILYTTNAPPPAEHRAEYPMRVATYASWQDADGVFFYHWVVATANDEYPNLPLWNRKKRGAHDLSTDEIMLSQMRAASALFVNGYIKPAAKPTIFTFGKKAILDGKYGASWFSSPNYALYSRTAFLHGAQIVLDSNLEGEVRIEGEVAGEEFIDFLAPSPQFKWDWKNGRFVIDTPEAKVVVGRLGKEWTFKDGVKVTNLNRDFVCFSLVSEDGKPLISSWKAILSVVSKSRNTGFVYDPSKKPPIVDEGTAPVIVDRVSAYVELPPIAGRTCKKIDFSLRVFKEENAENHVVISADEPVFVTILER